MRTGSTATGRRLPQGQLPSDRSCASAPMGHLSGERRGGGGTQRPGEMTIMTE